MRLEISTPGGLVLERDVEWSTVPTVSGDVGIFPGHVPLVAAVRPGMLRFGCAGSQEAIAVDRGFLHFRSDVLCLMVEDAIDVRSIDGNEAATARKKAEDALAEARRTPRLDAGEMARLEAKVRYQIVKQRAGGQPH
ncbi:MAG: ATP synthase F1 subunit epsilon [Puniceicoccales bacterium]|jgi:F-type H+-transporting ATPase subunit epsilon|nr:ATP synthase F1 subunit epsilon [Puniceicoccales bacterium]